MNFSSSHVSWIPFFDGTMVLIPLEISEDLKCTKLGRLAKTKQLCNDVNELVFVLAGRQLHGMAQVWGERGEGYSPVMNCGEISAMTIVIKPLQKTQLQILHSQNVPLITILSSPYHNIITV